MPPRKKLKTGAAAASSFAAGADTPMTVASMDDVPPIQRDCIAIFEAMVGLRHCHEGHIHSDARGPLVPSDGLLPFAVGWGGTLQDIAIRAFDSQDAFLDMSARLAHRVGLLESPDSDELLQQYCKLDVPRLLTLETFSSRPVGHTTLPCVSMLCPDDFSWIVFWCYVKEMSKALPNFIPR